ncbi:phage portal protein [Demequina gelatinilytica]|uniref:phage portal protein n=1 Tax=Demequina gelatinilytica TaxID=1638980 RepID=UPI00078546CE|nr:phage portal protein [Demequina gelatinilytica]
MSLFFDKPSERRSIDSLSWDAGGTLAGGLSATTATRLIPVYAATSLIADSIATLPLHAYTGSGAGRVRLERQPTILTNPQLTQTGRIAWLHQALASLLLHGNAYGYTVRLGATGWPEKLVWLNPENVRVDETGIAPRYFHRGVELDPAAVTHIPAYVQPGSIVGLSPIAAFRRQFTKADAAQQFGAAFFERGVTPAGILRNNNSATLGAEESAIAKRRFRAAVAGRDIFVTGKDWDWQQLSVSAADAIFLDAIEASATEIAAIYRVAPEDIGGKTGHSRQYATLVMELRKFNVRTVTPWSARFEEALTSLLPRGQYAKFNLDAPLRAEPKERMETHKIALELGLETLDDARALEEKPPLTDAERAEWITTFRPAARPTAEPRALHDPAPIDPTTGDAS